VSGILEEEREPCALTVAGSDSGAGAGIQADLKTFAAHGVFGISVLTMVTAQSTQGVDDWHVLSPELVERQLNTVFSDFHIRAMKTGALGTAGVIRALAGFLREQECPDLVIDPVMITKHGHTLLADEAVQTLVLDLMPLARVATPNLAEAERLADLPPIVDREGMVRAAQRITGLGCRAVVVKGGHVRGEPADLLWESGTATWFTGERIETPHTHGTGCTFSSAITAALVQGLDLPGAVEQAKFYVTEAIRFGRRYGKGINPVNHFWRTNRDAGERL
jgi:hydroxymethylpyrimidine/phosphomethylpyrimidine kinase